MAKIKLETGKHYRCVDNYPIMNRNLKGSVIVITKIEPSKPLSISFLLDDGISGNGDCTPEFAEEHFVPIGT